MEIYDEMFIFTFLPIMRWYIDLTL